MIQGLLGVEGGRGISWLGCCHMDGRYFYCYEKETRNGPFKRAPIPNEPKNAGDWASDVGATAI